MVFIAYLLGAQHNGRDSVEKKPASLIAVFLGKTFNGTPPPLFVADRWPTRTLLDYDCEVTNPAGRKRRLLGAYHWQSALLVVGLPVTHD